MKHKKGRWIHDARNLRILTWTLLYINVPVLIAVFIIYSFSNYKGCPGFYILYTGIKYLEGIHEAHIGSGLGSLINRPNPNQKANVRFYEIRGTVPPRVGAKAPRVLILALKLIKPGEELLVHYGNGFQIPKWT